MRNCIRSRLRSHRHIVLVLLLFCLNSCSRYAKPTDNPLILAGAVTTACGASMAAGGCVVTTGEDDLLFCDDSEHELDEDNPDGYTIMGIGAFLIGAGVLMEAGDFE